MSTSTSTEIDSNRFEKEYKDFSLQEIAKLLPNGVRVSHFAFGSKSRVNIFQGVWPANVNVDVHTHPSDYCEIVLSGKQKVGLTWYEAGDVRVAKAGTMYGPLSTGPEGCTILIIFAGADWSPIAGRRATGEGLYADTIEKILAE